jgi:hypothetical protein
MAALLGADLVDKLAKRLGVREIEGSTWLASVPVPTRDQESPPATSQLNDAVVLNPATGSVDFKRMQEGHIATQKLIEDFSVSLLPHATEVPKGMVEDDEHFRTLIQHRKQFAQMWIGRRFGIRCEIPDHLLGPAARQIMNADVKNGFPKWDAPLE